ncbi:unnamed protein product, partial [Didymodactylos carnosus]
VIDITSGSHYRGGSISWSVDPLQPTHDSVLIRISQRHSFRRTYSTSTFCDQQTITAGGVIGEGSLECGYNCPGANNGIDYENITDVTVATPWKKISIVSSVSGLVPCTDYSELYDYSSGEGETIVTIPTDVRFNYTYASCCWISLLTISAGEGWSLNLVIDTHRRRNGRFNSSPKSAMNPVVRLALGREHTIKIPMADSDGDSLRCRWGNTLTECGGICQPQGQLQSNPCEITYYAAQVGYEGIAIVIEDFESANSTVPLSSIPLQFLIQIVPPTTEMPITGVTGNYTVSPPCNPPVYVGRRPHGACIGVPSNAFVMEEIQVRTGCSHTTITDILTTSPQGMTKSNVTQSDPLIQPDIYSMYVYWTPQSYQTGIHQLCITPAASDGQTGTQACLTFQVDILPPELIGNSTYPQNGDTVSSNNFYIFASRYIFRPTRDAYIRFYRADTNALELEFNVVGYPSIWYQSNRLSFYTNFSHTWEEGQDYYILFDSGVITGNESCGVESSPISSPYFWRFHVALNQQTTDGGVTYINRSYSADLDQEQLTSEGRPIQYTTQQTQQTSTARTTTTTRTTATNTPEIITTATQQPLLSPCPRYWQFDTLVNVTTNEAEQNYTFCFDVNQFQSDVTITANTYVSCSNWKQSGAGDPMLELYCRKQWSEQLLAVNDDGNANFQNCFAAVLSYRLPRGTYKVVVRHPKCNYGRFELRLRLDRNSENHISSK